MSCICFYRIFKPCHAFNQILSYTLKWINIPVWYLRRMVNRWVPPEHSKHFTFISEAYSASTNCKVFENIQNLEVPLGPSPINSWPKLFPHFPQKTFIALAWLLSCGTVSTSFLTLSSRTVSLKAGHGVWCVYLLLPWNKSLPHFTHLYIPTPKWSLYFSLPLHAQNAMSHDMNCRINENTNKEPQPRTQGLRFCEV